MVAERRTRILIMRFVFFGAVLFAMVMASLPHPPQIPGQPSDKVQHIIAFAVLTLLARLAYPEAKRWRLFASLAVLGALIELVQTVPALHRDPSVLDWLADCGAVGVVMGIMALASKVAGTGVRDTSTQA
jgi:peptidoglycan/LPS O-acetylase OafA/YrhL